ncbi:mitochondrial cytochrome c oxidase-like protein subunit V [Calycina marina]|uniref:Cytochrome c oxidase polypeptide V n=1 Tax=Calycina marina TaxID=1763456 RepID=A0A9P7YYV5_9HELO|nr:mitochondrial cytochrome c oxidase-like protein subunit V [Calycina marina]
MMRQSLLRSSRSIIARPAVARPRVLQAVAATQSRGAHAISNPTLANIEKRWEEMPPQEQADLWMALRDRMKTNWAELTLQEQKAAYYIAFGNHGPRATAPPGEGRTIFLQVMAGLAASFVLFATIRMFAGPAPSTMNKEWQEATNEYLKAQNSEPISGLSSQGYKGPGQVQSSPKKVE